MGDVLFGWNGDGVITGETLTSQLKRIKWF